MQNKQHAVITSGNCAKYFSKRSPLNRVSVFHSRAGQQLLSHFPPRLLVFHTTRRQLSSYVFFYVRHRRSLCYYCEPRMQRHATLLHATPRHATLRHATQGASTHPQRSVIYELHALEANLRGRGRTAERSRVHNEP